MSQTRGDLEDVVNRLGNRNLATPLQQSAQILAFNKLEGNEMKSLILPTVKDPGNVFMVELGRGPCLLMETTNAFRIGRHFRWQDLEGDRAVQLRVPRPNHGGHAADTNRLQELEMGKPPATEHAGQGVLQAERYRPRSRDDGRGIVRRLHTGAV